MKVSLITEGTYPIHPGGVTTWCDEVVRGLPDVEFAITALSGSGLEPSVVVPPDNVTAVNRVGLWAPDGPTRPFTWPAHERFLSAYAQLVESVLRGGPRAAAWFETSLRQLRDVSAVGSLTTALRSQPAVDVFVDVWSRRAPAAIGPENLSLADALAVTDLIEHFLRPLQMPAVDGDVVHATANGPSMLFGLVAKWERGTPVLLSEHGVYLRERLLDVRRGGSSRAVRAGLVRFFARLTELGYRTADTVLPVSEFNGRWARRNGADEVVVLHNGVDPAAVPLLDVEPDEPTLVFAGRIDPLKDLETLIRAFALVRTDVAGARLRIFGGVPAGNEAYAARCRDLVTGLGLDDSVTFDGPVSPIGRAFAAGHAVVLSSRSEGLPLTLIEAAMSGRATITTDVGGAPEAVGDGGLVVPAGDPVALANACRSVLTDRGLRHGLATAGHAHAIEHFTLDRFLDRMRGHYERAAGSIPVQHPSPASLETA